MADVSSISMYEKIAITALGAIGIGLVGSRIFIRFASNIFIRYFDGIESSIKEIRADIKNLYDRTDNYQEVVDTIRYCKTKNRKKR